MLFCTFQVCWQGFDCLVDEAYADGVKSGPQETARTHCNNITWQKEAFITLGNTSLMTQMFKPFIINMVYIRIFQTSQRLRTMACLFIHFGLKGVHLMK